jgi:hypothetical protein
VLRDLDAVDEHRDEVDSIETAIEEGLGFAVVRSTSARLAALLLVPLAVSSSSIGSRLRAYPRVETPSTICSATLADRGSDWRSVSRLGSSTSPPPLRRTRGRSIAM